MEENEFKEKMQEKSKILGFDFSVEQISKFYKYMNMLIEWNEKINLTAIIEPNEIILKHFIDSLTIYKDIPNKSSVVDVGTGAGFPGIPLAIMNESLKITLVDSLNKRLIFLQEVINELNLKNIQAVHGRAEEYIREKREHYDIATSRAVAKLNVLLEYMIPFVKVGGRCICMKSFEIDEELKDAEKAIEILGGKIEKVDEIAERILTLGGVPLHSYAAYTKVATLKAKENVTDGDACLRAVVEDVQVLLKQEREILSVAAEIGDDGTQDVFSSYVSSQEKLLWMLDAYLNQK